MKLPTLIAVILVFVSPLSAQEPTQEESLQSSRALGEISKTLTTIAATLAEQTRVQRSALLLERLKIESDELRAVEAPWHRAVEQRTGLDTEIRELHERLAVEEDRLFRNADSDLDPEMENQMRAMRSEVQAVLGRLERKKVDADARVIELENRVQDQRLRHQDLRHRLDRLLEILEP